MRFQRFGPWLVVIATIAFGLNQDLRGDEI